MNEKRDGQRKPKKTTREKIFGVLGLLVLAIIVASITKPDKNSPHQVAQQNSNPLVQTDSCKGVDEYTLPTIGMSDYVFANCTVFGKEMLDLRFYHETKTASGVSKQYVLKPGLDVKYIYSRNGVIYAVGN